MTLKEKQELLNEECISKIKTLILPNIKSEESYYFIEDPIYGMYDYIGIKNSDGRLLLIDRGEELYSSVTEENSDVLIAVIDRIEEDPNMKREGRFQMLYDEIENNRKKSQESLRDIIIPTLKGLVDNNLIPDEGIEVKVGLIYETLMPNGVIVIREFRGELMGETDLESVKLDVLVKLMDKVDKEIL